VDNSGILIELLSKIFRKDDKNWQSLKKDMAEKPIQEIRPSREIIMVATAGNS
jgi:hypothetical protein